MFGLVAALLIMREPTEPLTVEALHLAREKWEQASVRDYDLRYRMHGLEYDVSVRGGIVESILTDGNPAHPADARLYGVDGLFDLLALELENATDPQGPFAARPGAVVMRVRFHEKLGYPERYLRSSAGMAKPVSIELIEFTSKK